MFNFLKKKVAVASTTAAVAVFAVVGSASAASLDLQAPTGSGLPTGTDLVGTAWSFASNFWEFLLIGLAALFTPKLFAVGRAALGGKGKK